MTDLYLTYEERSHGGDPIDPSDRWTDHEDEYVDFYPKQLYSSEDKVPGWLKETLYDVDAQQGDLVHLLVVRYTTGSTFGTSYGHWYIEGVYKDAKEATEIADKIRTGTYKQEGRTYLPWEGYFERLEDIQIYSLIVL